MPQGLVLELSMQNTTKALLDGGASMLRPLHRFHAHSIIRQASTKWLCAALVECLYHRQQRWRQAQQGREGQAHQEQGSGQGGQAEQQWQWQRRSPRRSQRLQPPPPAVPREAQQALTGQQAADVLLAAALGCPRPLFEHFLAAARAADQLGAARGVAYSLLNRASDNRDPGMLSAVLESGLCSDLAPAQLTEALAAACVPERAEAARALLRHGAPVSAYCVRQVVETGCSAASWAAVLSAYSIRSDRLQQARALLELLLRYGQPEVPLGEEAAPANAGNCPFFKLAQAARRLEVRVRLPCHGGSGCA